MKVLVAIASYGEKNDTYLARVLSEYRGMPYRCDIVVLSNVHKNLGADVEVITGLPARNPWSLPFRHKRILAERRQDYDLFIYSEDDILITRRNIDAFLKVTGVLPPERIAGFFRWETYPDGRRFFPEVHRFFRWVPESVEEWGGYTFAQFTNEHSGCYALTQSQLERAIDSGQFVVGPYRWKYGLPETAATDPYTRCGFKKVLCLSHLDDFLVHHLPNKHVGTWLGVDAPEVCKQIQVLLQRDHHNLGRARLVEPETKTFACEWSKDYYEPCRQDLVDVFPDDVKSVLSIGCGWGETEAALLRKGIRVVGVPLDSVIAACAESRGVELVYGNWEAALAQMKGQHFDGVLMSGILHLFPDPPEVLRQAVRLLRKNGALVATVPNINRVPAIWKRIGHPSRYRGIHDYQRSGLHIVGRRKLLKWLKDSGLAVVRVVDTVPDRWERVVSSAGIAGPLLSLEYTLVSRKR